MQTDIRSISLVEKAADSGRIVWADNAKAILITLVVLGHFAHLSANVKTLIYGFHLPAFLFITGFFLSPKLRTVSLPAFAARYIFPFVRLYVTVSIASVLLWWGGYMVLKRHLVSPADALINALYGTQWDGHRFIHENGALWYLPFLVCSFAAFFVAIRLPVLAALIAILAYFCFGALYTGYPLPWSAGAGGTGVAFIYMGYWARILLERDGPTRRLTFSRRTLAGIGLSSLVIFVALAFLNGRTNLNLLDFGHYYPLYVPIAMVGIVMIIAVSALLPHTRLTDDLSTNSLVIFCIHLYGVKVIGALGVYPDHSLARQIFILAMAVIVTIVSMYISKLAMPFVDRYVMRRNQR